MPNLIQKVSRNSILFISNVKIVLTSTNTVPISDEKLSGPPNMDKSDYPWLVPTL